MYLGHSNASIFVRLNNLRKPQRRDLRLALAIDRQYSNNEKHKRGVNLNSHKLADRHSYKSFYGFE